MKLTYVFAGALYLISNPIFAETTTFKAKVIGSESQLTTDGLRASALGASLDIDVLDDTQDPLTAVGGGADFEFHISDPMRLGLGASYIQFEGDDDQLGYSDFVLEAYSSVDFINQDVLAIYGKAGLSFHQLAIDEIELGRAQLEFGDSTLLNYDLGVGTRFQLNRETNFSLEYNYSNTFAAGDVDVTSNILGLRAPIDTKLENVSMSKNELVASLGFAF